MIDLSLPSFKVTDIRQDFPVLNQRVNGKPLVYLDNAATAQKPFCMIERLRRFYTEEYATIHRGVYVMSQRATEACDQSREIVRRFLNAKSASEIIFTRGATESINLVAFSFARSFIKAGQEILISGMEHHANIVPWQQVCEATGAVLKICPITDSGELDVEAFHQLLGPRTALVAMGHVSNALGTINPIKTLIQSAHHVGAKVLIDGAQAVAHIPIDVQSLNVDFYVFSSHKLYGPSGVGVLYAKYELLEAMVPYQTGGDMIDSVTFEKTTFAKPPYKFEAGTPAIAEIIGLGESIRYVEGLGFSTIAQIEDQLLAKTTAKLAEVPGLTIIGTSEHKAAVVSFILNGVHPHDIGTILDEEGIAIRAGHHCAQPVMQRFGIPATARASFAFYNTLEEVDVLVDAVKKAKELLS